MKPLPTGKKTPKKTPPPTPVQLDTELLQDLRAFAKERGLKNKAIGHRMGVSETYVSRAFNSNFIGSKEDFESRARALLHAAKMERRAPARELSSKGFLVAPMADFLSTVQHTADIGVAWSDAGKGKTCGIEIFRRTEPLSIVVTALKHRSGWRSIRDAILDELPQKRRQNNESWDDYLHRTFSGSGRLLIVDNAHLITESARAWLSYDWHEQTGCPVALVGNPEIVRQWKANDQHHSRVGLAIEVKPKASQRAIDTARDTLELLLPDAATDAATLRMAEAVVKSKGAVRSLQKHAKLTRELMQSPEYTGKPIATVFMAAHGLLLSDAKLEEAA